MGAGTSWVRRCSLAASLSLLGLACKPSAPGETETTTGGTGSMSDTTQGTTGGPTGPDSFPTNRDVDVLFVIDNSGSMGEEQATLAANFSSFVRVLEASNVRANYRIAITTTDHGNPRCTPPNFRAPDRGRFVLESCRDRLGLDGGTNDFLFEALGVDATYACTDSCDPAVHDALASGLKPSTIAEDATEEPRRWVESTLGVTNLPDGVAQIVADYPANLDNDPNNDISPVGAAMRCFGPQGINGCGFESQLESIYSALRHTSDPEEPNYGFLRDNAVLAVVIVTDEADCSFITSQQSIFLDLGSTWSWEPGATSPTSAVCWNAGVECEGAEPGPYIECNPVDRDIDGAIILDPFEAMTDAVLHPLGRYADFLEALEMEKKTYSADQEIIVSVIGGVPSGYADNAAEIEYVDDADIQEQINFGIGPGCVSANGNAIPPVRMRDFAEAFATGERNLFSICDDDYSDALQAIADRIGDKIVPACYPKCVADTDPDTEVVDPSCALTQVDGQTEEETPILECVFDPAPVPPPGETVCFAYRVDKGGQTPTEFDDMDDKCVTEGWNLEFQLVRTVPAPPGTSVTASCQLSDSPAVDCPGL